jgi:DNA-binding FrmR family transcriptional regulator
MNGLMAEVVEGHIRNHLVDPDRDPTSEAAKAAVDLIDVVRAYLK